MALPIPPNPFTAGAPTNDTDTMGVTMGTPMKVMGGPPIATAGLFAQHGSAEQNTRGFNLNSMTPPRTPRDRSPAAGDMDDETRRFERSRESRRRDNTEPVGSNFRLSACERTLRDQTSELTAQRIAISQLTEVLQRVSTDKEAQDTRLNEVFQHVDAKFTEAMNRTQVLEESVQQMQVIVSSRIETLTQTINNISQGLAARIESLTMEIEVMRRLQPSAPERSNAPPAPQSWSAAPPTAEDPLSTPPGFASPGHPFVGTGQAPMQAPPPVFAPPTPAPAPAPSASVPMFHQMGSPMGGNEAQFPTSGLPHQPRMAFPTTTLPQDQRFPSPAFGHGGDASVPESPFAATGSRYAPGAGTENQPFDPRSWSTDGKKVTKELKNYDGDMARYDNWRRRIRDHFVNTNHNYCKIFDLVETTKSPIKWAALASTQVAELPFLDWQWVATHLWTFTANYLTDTQIERRGTLCMGEEFNGLELWRTLYRENCGGSAQLANLERGHFIAFPKCNNASELRIHLGQWIEMKQKYGIGLPEDHLISMFHNILPDDVKEDVKKQRDIIGSLQRQIEHVMEKIDTFTEDRLSRWNLTKLQSQLKSKQKNTTGVNALNANDSGVAAPPAPDETTMAAHMERMIAAAVARAVGDSSQRGRSGARSPQGSRNGSAGSQRSGRRVPSASFVGCWCCGEKGHARKDCKKFNAIKDANGGKVPKDYVGAYEKSLASQSSTKRTAVKALSVAPVTSPAPEFDETVSLWPTLRSPAPIATSNKYATFADSDDEDETEVVKALAALSPNVMRSSDRSLPQRVKKSRQRDSRPLDVAHIKAIARDVRQGKITLPEIDLESDAEYTCVWALVDSGAGANVSRKTDFPNSEPVEGPAIKLSAANGEIIPNIGAHRVYTRHRDGTQTSRVFYHADVEMPILSVTELTKEGESGTEVRFRRKDGIMVDNTSGRRQHFVKRKGVYFIKLYVNKPGSNTSGFTRPEM